jgi:sugar transferase EpsL
MKAPIPQRSSVLIYAAGIKRTADFALATLGMIVALPVMAIVSLVVRIMIGPRIIFSQERTGLHGQNFRVYKYRTMLDTQGPNGVLLSDEQRLTRTGRVLRALSLDELPQLWNVLRGEMSLVGPRPLPAQYRGLYSPAQARRHEVKPGITGWAQVNGRNTLSWEEKFELDVWYVDHLSMGLDLKILLKTACRLLLPRGIAADGHATAPVFTGTPPKADDQVESSAHLADQS